MEEPANPITSDATTKQTLDNAEQARAGAEASVAQKYANLTKVVEQLGYAQLKAESPASLQPGRGVGQVVTPGQNVVT
jgi:multidrug efflux pump subunit AcrA (membrane-fusion protein)